ncbi:hypothetical protein NPIL_122621, partial [Nephila pilipes]
MEKEKVVVESKRNANVSIERVTLPGVQSLRPLRKGTSRTLVDVRRRA